MGFINQQTSLGGHHIVWTARHQLTSASHFDQGYGALVQSYVKAKDVQGADARPLGPLGRGHGHAMARMRMDEVSPWNDG